MTSHAKSAPDQIDAVRHFNRFYTRQLGLLDEGLLASAFSLTEARILFELAHHDQLTATALCADLGLDPGYLSRILKRFEEQGLLAREPHPDDARQVLLTLTPAGRRAFAPLDQGSRDQIAGLLGALAPGERDALIAAMQTIERSLTKTPEPQIPYILRPLRVGDVGWITHRQGLLYHQEYGWDETYEALVAKILSDFVQNFNSRREASWIAERAGQVVGSVFVVEQSETVAKLRLLYVEPAVRGLGIGRRLVDECISFARAKGYKTLTLWTNDVLVSARRIYEAAGFKLVEQEPHHSFGKDLIGQTWSLAL